MKEAIHTELVFNERFTMIILSIKSRQFNHHDSYPIRTLLSTSY